jgi:hypothetical protein
MDLLIVEPLEDEVTQWLTSRHTVRYAPELAHDPRAFRQALYNVRALIIPPSVTLDSKGAALCARSACRRTRERRRREHRPRRLRPRRLSKSCAASPPQAQAEAEFMIGALCRCCGACRWSAPTACWSGRELGSCTVGLIGMAIRRTLDGAAARTRSAPRWSATTRRCTPATRSGSAGRCGPGVARAARDVRTRCACSSTTSRATTACWASASCRSASRIR